MKKKKVMFFINTLAGGGAEKVLTNFFNAVDYHQYDCTVITVIGGENLKLIPSDVKVKQIIKTKNKGLIRVLKSILYHLPRKLFARLFLKGDFDIEIAYLPGFPTRSLAAKRRKEGVKRFAFIHGEITKDIMERLLYKTPEECLAEYKKYDRVCFVSKNAKNIFENSIGKLDNSRVVYNVIDYDQIKERSKEVCEEEYRTKGLKMIAVGRLMPVKGFERLLKAVANLRNYDFELWILGKGDLQNSLQSFIDKEGLDNVRLLGYKENPYCYIKKADLMVCSSYSEGYSTAVSEGISLGVPVLTTRCSGMDEILQEDRYGIIVENDGEALKNGLERILKNDGDYQRVRSNVQEYSQLISVEIALQGYIDLFEGKI